MSRRRDLEDHLHALGDISGILRAMKNLALMETQKLTRFLGTQRRVVESIEAAAADLLTHSIDLDSLIVSMLEAFGVPMYPTGKLLYDYMQFEIAKAKDAGKNEDDFNA